MNPTNINSEQDFWSEANTFAKTLVVEDIEQRFTDYCREHDFSHNEKQLFRRFIVEAISLNFVTSMLKTTSPR